MGLLGLCPLLSGRVGVAHTLAVLVPVFPEPAQPQASPSGPQTKSRGHSGCIHQNWAPTGAAGQDQACPGHQRAHRRVVVPTPQVHPLLMGVVSGGSQAWCFPLPMMCSPSPVCVLQAMPGKLGSPVALGAHGLPRCLGWDHPGPLICSFLFLSPTRFSDTVSLIRATEQMMAAARLLPPPAVPQVSSPKAFAAPLPSSHPPTPRGLVAS